MNSNTVATRQQIGPESTFQPSSTPIKSVPPAPAPPLPRQEPENLKICQPETEPDGQVAPRQGEPPPVDYLSAATHWFGFGFRVLPIAPGTKKSAVKWDPWSETLSQQQIQEYWQQHPDHELGCIVGEDMIVFDADTIEGVTAMYTLETRFKLEPALVVLTSKGQHHYFRVIRCSCKI